MFAKWLLLEALLVLLIRSNTRVSAVDISWTKYSDSAELPMSTQWREGMRQKLLNLDVTELTPKQKMQRKQLLRQLNSQAEQVEATPLWLMFCAVVPLCGLIAIAMWQMKKLQKSCTKESKIKKGR
eukprot:gnl/MRDRNA2_/MRDRNA2_160827_c0_seq1.p1 gnl/MRDRNA2_/MRDRNA2_160827_c0~~gnl/MRDRNA2_/MRDRNA2_160827_c0_seq1.p1  ORF type:complete len:126 (-),score=28.43 gnl/MRDRNA2_/MRDRNA2_160827_c0_seq1:138-515(-)